MTHVENFLRRSLQVGKAVAGVVVVQGRHKAVLGFERNRINARIFFLVKVRLHTGLHCQGHQRSFGGISLQLPLPSALF